MTNESLQNSCYLVEPAHQAEHLLTSIELKSRLLFKRLFARGLFVRQLKLQLRCEYSDQLHHLCVEPTQPHRDLSLFIQMLRQKVFDIQFDNPIREYQITLETCSEKTRQLSFLEPQTQDNSKVERLLNLLAGHCKHIGFFQLNNELLPEKSWETSMQTPSFRPQQDLIERQQGGMRILPAHGKGNQVAPRPTRLLTHPQLLLSRDLQQIRILNHQATEIIETHWWQQSEHRKYYIALSPQQDLLWIFQNQIDQQFYLHGYFD